MSTIHEMARTKLLIQAYNVFLINKGVVLAVPSHIPATQSVQDLEKEFLDMVMETMLRCEPCKEHTMVLTDTTTMYRLKTYKCVRCDHMELKD